MVRDYLKIRPDWAMIRRILGIGIPSGVENSMFQLGKLAIQSTVSTLGTTAIAATGNDKYSGESEWNGVQSELV